MNKCKFSEIAFVFFVGIILLGGFIYSLFMKETISQLENRSAYKYKAMNLNNFLSKEFQNSIEDTLSDQLPFSMLIKEKYNYLSALYSKYMTNFVVSEKCDNRYFYYSNGCLAFGCNEYLVSKYDSSDVIFRINKINEIISNSDVPVYLYYIERYDDINLEDNQKMGLFEKLKSNLKIEDNYISHFEIKSSEEYEKYFYKTDHHLNNVGAYKAYTEIANMLGIKNIVKYSAESCHKLKYSGSKARTYKVYDVFVEDFCIYDFDYPKHTTLVNGVNKEYGISRIDDTVSPDYVKYAGFDSGEVVFDYYQPGRKNILILGNSYDNAYVKLLATHFNKTYAVDIRHYKDEIGKEFNYLEYIEEKNIDIVLLNGDNGYFRNTIYDFEVK